MTTEPALTPVESSSIDAYRYDEAAGELHIRFKSGSTVHVYEGVGPEVAMAFELAPSLGKHFHEHIRGEFKSRKVEAGPK